jgi:hypothetical protein
MMDPFSIAMGIGGLLSLFKGGGGDKPAAGGNTDVAGLMQSIPGLGRSMELQTARAERSDPLHAALTQLAMNFMPRAGFEQYPGRAGQLAASLPRSVTPYQIKAPTRIYDPRDPRSRPQGSMLPGDAPDPPSPSQYPDDERFRG